MADKEMTFIEHLEELRSRLWVIVASVLAMSILCYHWTPVAIGYFARQAGHLVFLAPAEAFLIRLKIALIGGLFLALPIVLFEIWRFVSLGLRPKEHAMLLKVVPASWLLFALGAALAIFGVAPKAMGFLLVFGSDQLVPMITASAYVGFVLFLALAFGLVFQLPLVVLLLAKFELVNHWQLVAYRKAVYLAIVAGAAVLTPGPDVFSQILLAAPTVLLYEISVLMVRLVEAKSRSVPTVPLGERL